MNKNPRTEVPSLKEATKCPGKQIKTDQVKVHHCDIRDKQKILKRSEEMFYPKYQESEF